MAELREIVEFADALLSTKEIPDYPGAHNGLQVENPGVVTKVACAVDASEAVICDAIAKGADLLVVHHGLFWQGVRMLTGANYRKFKMALESGLAIYSSHLPLDVHSEIGNNVLLAERLNLRDREFFHDWKGVLMGIRGCYDGDFGQLRVRLGEVLGGPVVACGEDSDEAGLVGVITGGAGSEVEAIAREGVSTFVTGEGPHWSFPLANELGLKVLHGGHYATETFGIRALAKRIANQFEVENLFLDHPTGL